MKKNSENITKMGMETYETSLLVTFSKFNKELISIFVVWWRIGTLSLVVTSLFCVIFFSERKPMCI
jgi:hypothetical protein